MTEEYTWSTTVSAHPSRYITEQRLEQARERARQAIERAAEVTHAYYSYAVTYVGPYNAWRFHSGWNQETEEQRAERLRREEEAQRLRIEAENKSLEILKDNLDERQSDLFEREGKIVVDKISHRYVIEKGYSFNIRVERAKKAWLSGRVGYDTIGKICFGPRGNLPIYDHMLAQKVALESVEREALSVANKETWRGR